MKKVFTIMAFLAITAITAQSNKPVFEKVGDQIKGTFYHDNGTIQQQGFYQAGKLHGEWISYDIQGEKLALAQYNEGVKTGKWFLWNNGVLTEVDYKNNAIASVVKWSDKNTIVSSD